MVVLDATMLLLFLNPDAGIPRDSAGNVIPHARERVVYLIKRLNDERIKIVIPAPALAEVLVRAPNRGAGIVAGLEKSARAEVVSFDQRAAIEVAMMTREALEAGNKKGDSASPWQKLKYDRQIVAIAKVAGVRTIYSDDADIRSIAPSSGIGVVSLADLPLPPVDPQPQLPLEQLPLEQPKRKAADEPSKPAAEEDEDAVPPPGAIAEVQGDGDGAKVQPERNGVSPGAGASSTPATDPAPAPKGEDGDKAPPAAPA